MRWMCEDGCLAPHTHTHTLPLHRYAYTSVHRILCPLLNIDDAPGDASILVDLSTSSIRTLNFTLRVSIVKQYKLE